MKDLMCIYSIYLVLTNLKILLKMQEHSFLSHVTYSIKKIANERINGKNYYSKSPNKIFFI